MLTCLLTKRFMDRSSFLNVGAAWYDRRREGIPFGWSIYLYLVQIGQTDTGLSVAVW